MSASSVASARAIGAYATVAKNAHTRRPGTALIDRNGSRVTPETHSQLARTQTHLLPCDQLLIICREPRQRNFLERQMNWARTELRPLSGLSPSDIGLRPGHHLRRVRGSVDPYGADPLHPATSLWNQRV